MQSWERQSANIKDEQAKYFRLRRLEIVGFNSPSWAVEFQSDTQLGVRKGKGGKQIITAEGQREFTCWLLIFI